MNFEICWSCIGGVCPSPTEEASRFKWFQSRLFESMA